MEWEDIFGAESDRLVRAPASRELEMLQSACETEPPVSMMAAHMTLSSPGRLVAADQDGVTVDLPNPPDGFMRAGAMAAVRFPLGGNSAGFTSNVLAVTPLESGAARLTLSIPAEIRTDDQRAAVRIPVLPKTLAAAMFKGERPLPVTPIDIGLLGMCIEDQHGSFGDLEVGHRRMLALKLGADSVLVEAEIRRCDGPRSGMAFILRNERPAKLVKIVSKLQYLWCAQ